ncbi:MAG: hypothetical protein KF757_13510 [Phycisphaeraceae bacterium]|nr:hypothetical protein [Phycisphaeraceae bacterium]MCW5763979.1 hypothetical protein [Phycisphaeraceae bacterium]
MKWILGVVLALVVLVGAGAFLGVPALMKSLEQERAAARAKLEAMEMEIVAREAQERAAADAARVQDASLARLEAELARAEPVKGKSDAERLEAAWAWVRANRDADRPYNELEATMLALLDAFFDGEERSALWMINTSMIEFEMIRSLDVDGDGQVTDEEFEMFMKENVSLMMATDHPYFIDRFDTDGDGKLSMDERMAIMETMSGTGAMSGALERAQLEAWDTDYDGVLSDAERDAGRAAAKARFTEMMDAAFEMDLSHLSEEQRAATLAQIEAQRDAMMEMQNEAMMSWAVAEKFFEAMRLENMSPEELRAAMMQDMPPSPDYMSFDADGDGVLDEAETAAFHAATQSMSDEMMEWAARQGAMMLRMQFEHASRQSDLNGDGLMSPDEWERRLEMLTLERDRRLFLQSYDLDRDGRVTSDELGKYLDWHNAGSLRSDANYDGVIDARDLELMLRLYREQ